MGGYFVARVLHNYRHAKRTLVPTVAFVVTRLWCSDYDTIS